MIQGVNKNVGGFSPRGVLSWVVSSYTQIKHTRAMIIIVYAPGPVSVKKQRKHSAERKYNRAAGFRHLAVYKVQVGIL